MPTVAITFFVQSRYKWDVVCIYSIARKQARSVTLRNCSQIKTTPPDLSDMATAKTLRAETALLSYDQVPETKYERRQYPSACANLLQC
jgi:hypothetical protein